MTFHDFFLDLFKFSITLGSAVTFENFQNFPCFRVLFDLKQFNRHKLWCPLKWVPFALFNSSSLHYVYIIVSYIVLALSPAVTDLSNKTLIFHDFQGPSIKFYEFPGLENEILKFPDFQVFHDLYKSCWQIFFKYNLSKQISCFAFKIKLS